MIVLTAEEERDLLAAIPSLADFPWSPPPGDYGPADPLHWHHEYVIDFVLMMYEYGDVMGFRVDHAQGDRPRLSWTASGRKPNGRSVR